MAEEVEGGFTIHFGDTDNWENMSVETLTLVSTTHVFTKKKKFK